MTWYARWGFDVRRRSDGGFVFYCVLFDWPREDEGRCRVWGGGGGTSVLTKQTPRRHPCVDQAKTDLTQQQTTDCCRPCAHQYKLYDFARGGGTRLPPKPHVVCEEGRRTLHTGTIVPPTTPHALCWWMFVSLAGKPDEAEKLGLRALSIVEKAYGPVHPEIATCLNNLSALLHARR